MITDKEFQLFEKMGITFKLSPNGKYANISKKGKFVGNVYNTKNMIYFCGKEFIETTGREIIEFLNKNNPISSEEVSLTNDEIFDIWKRCITEDRHAGSFDKEFGKKENYIYNAFRRLKLPKTIMERKQLDESILKNLMAQKCYADAKQFLI